MRGKMTSDTSVKSNPNPSAILKYSSLVALTTQNTANVLLLRYIRTRDGPMFFSTVGVVMAEVMKFIISLTLVFKENNLSVKETAQYLNEKIFQSPWDCVKISVPAILYCVQNNLLYVGVSNLDAATFQVTYQLKILTTALMTVLMLDRTLSKQQWMALIILFVGVSMVQLDNVKDKPMNKTNGVEQRPWLGLGAVLLACFTSGYAGVFFEKMLKHTSPSLWLRNIQLSFYGGVIGAFGAMLNDGANISENGFLFGFDSAVWLGVTIQAAGGLLVAVVVKYTDNILKGFSTSVAIVLAVVFSMFFFAFQPSLLFVVGTALVTVSVYVYNVYPPAKPLPKVVSLETKVPSIAIG